LTKKKKGREAKRKFDGLSPLPKDEAVKIPRNSARNRTPRYKPAILNFEIKRENKRPEEADEKRVDNSMALVVYGSSIEPICSAIKFCPKPVRPGHIKCEYHLSQAFAKKQRRKDRDLMREKNKK